jgi:hypothetical protein
MIQPNLLLSPSGRLLALILLPFLMSGCGTGAADPLATVQGKVYYKGVPLRSGFIAFTPDILRGNSGPVAFAEIQPDGSYTLRCDQATGAVPGWHRVTVVAVETSAQPGREVAAVRTLIPEKYRDPELSGLVCEVRAGQANAIHFHLE